MNFEAINCYICLMLYNWQQKDWTNFSYEKATIKDLLAEYLDKTAFLKGKFSMLNESEKTEVSISLMTNEALKTSEIEGEFLLRSDIRSSIRNNLGFNSKKVPVYDLRATGITQMMASVRSDFQKPLTQEALFSWHESMLSYREDMIVGNWRTHEAPMQIVSGAMGRERVHFTAPPSSRVPEMMDVFLNWFNQSTDLESSLRAAIAHLWFESIHPFEDGNGRIGRAISEKALSQGLASPAIFSLSQIIEADKKSYYSALEVAQQSNEITDWLVYFIGVVNKAVEAAKLEINFTVQKGRFYQSYQAQLNERQLKAINRMFEAGVEGFEGGMNARKYVAITGSSRATATRDMQQLATIGAFLQIGGGRSIRYELNLS